MRTKVTYSEKPEWLEHAAFVLYRCPRGGKPKTCQVNYEVKFIYFRTLTTYLIHVLIVRFLVKCPVLARYPVNKLPAQDLWPVAYRMSSFHGQSGTVKWSITWLNLHLNRKGIVCDDSVLATDDDRRCEELQVNQRIYDPTRTRCRKLTTATRRRWPTARTWDLGQIGCHKSSRIRRNGNREMWAT